MKIKDSDGAYAMGLIIVIILALFAMKAMNF